MAQRENVEKIPEEDPLSLIRVVLLLNFIVTLVLVILLYTHINAEEGLGFYVRPPLPETEILAILRAQNISSTPEQGEALTSALNDLVETTLERSGSEGVVTVSTGAVETDGSGEGGSSTESATVTVDVNGNTLNIDFWVNCCGTCNTTAPACPPPETTCSAYGVTCRNDSECCDPYSCIEGQCDFTSSACQTSGSCTSNSECCEGLQCIDGLCNPPPSECKSYASACLNDSECCSPYACIQGYCGFPPVPMCNTSGPCQNDSECCSPYTCSNGYCNPSPSCSERNQACSSTSECCESLICDNSSQTCRPPPSCTPQGEYCIYSSECCPGSVCVNSACSPPSPECQEEGEYCAASTECCSGLVCNQNQQCIPMPTELCSETDKGANYYLAGTTTGYLDGMWGSYTDYCEGPNKITEYSCQIIYGYDASGYPTTTPTQNVSRASGVTCARGCNAGKCNT